MKLSEAMPRFNYEKMVREFAEIEARMHATSGHEHNYWLGKSVGMTDAVAILCDVDWITAHSMLGNAANEVTP